MALQSNSGKSPQKIDHRQIKLLRTTHLFHKRLYEQKKFKDVSTTLWFIMTRFLSKSVKHYALRTQ